MFDLREKDLKEAHIEIYDKVSKSIHKREKIDISKVCERCGELEELRQEMNCLNDTYNNLKNKLLNICFIKNKPEDVQLKYVVVAREIDRIDMPDFDKAITLISYATLVNCFEKDMYNKSIRASLLLSIGTKNLELQDDYYIFAENMVKGDAVEEIIRNNHNSVEQGNKVRKKINYNINNLCK